MGKGQLVKAMLPFKPLDDFLTEQLGIDAKADQRGMAIGLENRVSYNKLRHRNQVSWHRGDFYATSLGVHPSSIWRDWYEVTDFPTRKPRYLKKGDS